MKPVKADPNTILMWANNKKCTMCSHTKEEGHILPKGEFYPSPSWMFHYQDTHGFPKEIVMKFISNSVYGLSTDIKDLVKGVE